MTALGINITDRDPVTTYEWKVGESEKAAIRKAHDLSERVWQLRDEVIDCMVDLIIHPDIARPVIEGLAQIANGLQAGTCEKVWFENVSRQVDGYAWLRSTLVDIRNKFEGETK